MFMFETHRLHIGLLQSVSLVQLILPDLQARVLGLSSATSKGLFALSLPRCLVYLGPYRVTVVEVGPLTVGPPNSSLDTANSKRRKWDSISIYT